MTFEALVEFDDIFEMLETVRQYSLRPKETLISLNSVDGSVMGYCTAHLEHASIEWTISTKVAKNSARARGTKEGVRIAELLANAVGRKQLLQELRAGELEYGIAHQPEPPAPPKPRQATIPGL